MSVDISQLTARLDPQRQEAVKQQYEGRATSPTVAFLLCFFLGSAGAHRFYLHEWRVAFAHLALFVAGVAALAGGLVQTLPLTVNLTSHPLGAALDALGVFLLLAALIWEIIDLGRIDHQVYQRNLLLAEGIIAGTLLADHTVIDQTLQRMESTAQRAREQAHAAAAPPVATAAPAVAEAAAVAGAGVITANEVADARALAEETGGFAAISYSEMSRFDVSAPPADAQPAATDAAHTGNWTERATTLGTAPGATPDAAPIPVAETVTHTHTEDGPRVTDGYEVDHVEGPSAADVMGLGAAGLGAAGLGAAGLGAAGLGAAGLGAEALAHEYVGSAAGFDEPTQPDIAASAAPQAGAFDPTDAQPTPRTSSYDPTDGLLAAGAASALTPEVTPEPAPAASYDLNGYDFEDDDVGDITDASLPAVVSPAADVGLAHASPVYVQLPEEPGAQPETYAAAAPEEPVAPLYLIPDEAPTETTPEEPYSAAPAYDAYDAYSAYNAEASEEPPAEAYVPPVASVFSAPAEQPVAPTPSWDQPTIAQAAPEPEPQPAEDGTLAELAGYAGAGAAGALAADAWAQSHAAEPEASAPEPVTPAAAPGAAPEPVAAPEPPKMKRIRVRRKVVVDGQVVAEEVVEREVPADMDTAEAAARIQAELAHFTPEQIAQRANLSPNEEVELHQRTEGLGEAQ